LFAETPNYRGLSVAVSGKDNHRWHFGPMFYRGRLGDDQVKVLVVGQEGAQDESLAHRSFVGGTGARMQYFLKHLGITRSYLFLNTFVYPIKGQYVGAFPVLAQHEDSPIREHREELFDYLADRNDLRLAIAVGRAAKESLASWVESHGGQADPDRLHLADSDRISPKLKMVGVLHPGGASKGGALTAIVASFKAASTQIDKWAKASPTWLVEDPGGVREAPSAYKYRSAPIPFRDLPFGSAWRIGSGTTSSNRRDGQESIQIFSEDGVYENRDDPVSYSGPGAGTTVGYAADTGDLAYEPPKQKFRDYDPGPGSGFARLLQGGVAGKPWPDFQALGLAAHPSYGTGPIYRGRLSKPSILVVGDQESQDDLFTFRALTGEGGQRLQAFLTAAGVTRSYGILRVLPVDTLGAAASGVRAAVDDPAVRAVYAEVIKKSQPKVVVTVGPNSARLVGAIAPNVAAVVKMKSPTQTGYAADWRNALNTLSGLSYRRDTSNPSYDYQGEREQIPRLDLPYGTLRWQATSGSRAERAKRNNKPTSDYYKFRMPGWAAALKPAPLSASETAAAQKLKQAL
jgi:uracil-DNA glycosylase